MNLTKQLSILAAGGDIICSSEELDEIEKDAADHGVSIRSLRNPNQIGTKDQWLVWIKEGYRGINRQIIEKNNEIDLFLNA